MKIETSRHGAVTVVRPDGPLVAEDMASLIKGFEDAAVKSLGRVVVDCSASPYADSEGLEGLLDLVDHQERGGQALKLIGVGETLRESMTLTETAPRFEFFSDLNSAVRSFS